MNFAASHYGPEVAHLLALDGGGHRLMPLVCREPSPHAPSLLRRMKIEDLFPAAPHPRAAMAGLWLYFSCFEEAHQLADSIEDPHGYFWHAIVHRQEPDAGNSAYWFRKVGTHPVFPRLASEAAAWGPRFGPLQWDPYAFIAFCEEARRSLSQESTAREIQRIEWQLLFDHCARPPAGVPRGTLQ